MENKSILKFGPKAQLGRLLVESPTWRLSMEMLLLARNFLLRFGTLLPIYMKNQIPTERD